jgi:hypothetical protein
MFFNVIMEQDEDVSLRKFPLLLALIACMCVCTASAQFGKFRDSPVGHPLSGYQGA